jgi:acetyl-CoA carboxylase biotin carboxyl carrier protein
VTKPKNVIIGGKEKLTLEDIRRLISILRRNGVSEFDLEQNGMRIRIITGSNDRAGKSAEAYFPQMIPNPVSSVVPMIAPGMVASPNGSAPAPPTPTLEPPKANAAEQKTEEALAAEKGVHIKSPMVGTFYRAPAPDAPPYVDVGDEVKEETVLCIVEAMKLMNEIKAELRGKILEILVENGQPVEYGQPLFLVETL